MCRPSSDHVRRGARPLDARQVFVCLVGLAASLWVASGALAQSSVAERRRTEARVDELGLGYLRIGQYESRLTGPGPKDLRQPFAEDLARAYLQEVVRGSGPLEESLHGRVDAFLEEWDVGVEDSLRLAVARRDYEAAVPVGERARLGQASAADVQWARGLMNATSRGSSAAAQHLEVVRAEQARALARATGQERLKLERSLESVDELLLQARYRQAWAGYWVLWFGLEEAATEQARRAACEGVVDRFARVLEIDSGVPRAADASVDLRGIPYYASAIEGMALAQALAGRSTGDASIALDWVALLQHEATAPESKAAAPDVAILVAVDARDWRRVADAVNGDAPSSRALQAVIATAIAADAGSSGSPGTTSGRTVAPGPREVALGAVYGLLRSLDFRAIRGSRTAMPAAWLSSNPTLTAMLDGSDAIVAAEESTGSDRELHARAAVEPMRKALQDEQVASRPEVARSARAALGWALLEANRPAEAAPILEKASEDTWDQAERLLWLAITARERAAGSGAASDPILARLRQSYHDRFPQSGRGSALLVRDSASRTPPEVGFVVALRQVPPGDVAWGDAQRELSRIHYWNYRNASGEERRAQARALLALPVPARDPRSGLAPDTVLRRQLEAAVDGQVADLAAADHLLAIARELTKGGATEAIVAEIACRTVQRACLDGDCAAAASSLRLMPEGAEAAPWRAVARATFLSAVERASAAGVALPAEVGAMASHCARALLLEAQAGRSGDIRAVLRASELLLAAGQLDGIREAKVAIEGLPDADRSTPLVLELSGRVKHALGDDAAAVHDYTLAVNAISQGDPAWYRVKARLVRLLESSDPNSARALLQQHHALDPNWGPGADGDALRDAAARLGVGAPS